MKFLSTRQDAPPVDAARAIRAGAAPDGGLYLPERLPVIERDELLATSTVAEAGQVMLTPFFAGSALESVLDDICTQAFDFPVPIVAPDSAQPGRHVLELFQGPTGAFKDFGARFLFRCFDRLADPGDPITVLAATSGDTGGAVGCAAEGAHNASAVILFPKGRISAFQERQLCCWGAPVQALRIDADFDTCQALVKTAFRDRALSQRHGLTSANSISVGRLLPQMAYWTHAAAERYKGDGVAPGLIIPTGNLGNAVAAILARACGAPIGPVVLATNANRTLADWFDAGEYEARASIPTLANAMDVGAPSNFERLAALRDQPIHGVISVDDATIRARIQTEYQASGYIACPHTATALEAFAHLPDTLRNEQSWLIGATAHPYKFADVVEPIIRTEITPPPALADVLERPTHVRDITPDLAALSTALASGRA